MPKKALFLFSLSLLLVVGLASAQGAPDQINAALADLGVRVGRTLTLSNMQSWRWEQNNYPDASLGCPQPDQLYAQVLSVGYKFTFTYAGSIYDYRVSADSSTVILCSVTDVDAPTPTPDPSVPVVVTYTPPCPTVEPNTNYLRIRLAFGSQARVVPGLPNNLRAQPTTESALVGEIPGGSIFSVISGPQCGEGFVWWQVNYDGAVGWTVEGRDGEYWIEPLPPLDLPPVRPLISKDNASQLNEIARLHGNFVPRVAFAPDAKLLAVLGGRGSEGVWVYNVEKLSETPRILPDDGLLSALVFSPTRPQILTGGLDGRVTLFEIRREAPILQSLVLQTHQSDVVAVAFNPAGDQFLSAGNSALTNVDIADKSNVILLWDLDNVAQAAALAAHLGKVRALAFSPNGALIASGGLDAAVQLWALADNKWQVLRTWQQGAGVYTLAFSPDGSLIAAGGERGTVKIWRVADGAETVNIGGQTGYISAVAFSPDGALLAVASDDGTVNIWDLNAQITVPLITLKGTYERVLSAAFSPDGTLLAIATSDNTVRIFGTTNSFG